jgi:hypothetical protein
VRVVTVGRSEEGREMIAVAVADENCSTISTRTARASRNSPIRACWISTTRRPKH